MPLNCEHIRNEFSALLDDELNIEDRELIEEHLSDCSDCLRELHGYKQVNDAYRYHHPVKAPEDFEARLREALAPAEEPRATRSWAPFGLAAAAAIGLVSGFAMWYTGQAPEQAMLLSKAEPEIAATFESQPILDDQDMAAGSMENRSPADDAGRAPMATEMDETQTQFFAAEPAPATEPPATLNENGVTLQRANPADATAADAPPAAPVAAETTPMETLPEAESASNDDAQELAMAKALPESATVDEEAKDAQNRARRVGGAGAMAESAIIGGAPAPEATAPAPMEETPASDSTESAIRQSAPVVESHDQIMAMKLAPAPDVAEESNAEHSEVSEGAEKPAAVADTPAPEAMGKPADAPKPFQWQKRTFTLRDGNWHQANYNNQPRTQVKIPSTTWDKLLQEFKDLNKLPLQKQPIFIQLGDRWYELHQTTPPASTN